MDYGFHKPVDKKDIEALHKTDTKLINLNYFPLKLKLAKERSKKVEEKWCNKLVGLVLIH